MSFWLCVKTFKYEFNICIFMRYSIWNHSFVYQSITYLFQYTNNILNFLLVIILYFSFQPKEYCDVGTNTKTVNLEKTNYVVNKSKFNELEYRCEQLSAMLKSVQSEKDSLVKINDNLSQRYVFVIYTLDLF